MPCNPTICPDCSYPPNFQISELPKNSAGNVRYEIDCRDCGDVWIEEDEPDSGENYEL
jgi:hypothetical protein